MALTTTFANQFVAVAGISLLAQLAQTPLAAREQAAGRLVVQTRKNADAALVTRTLGVHGARVRNKHAHTDVWVIDVPESQSAAISAALEKTGLFTFVEPDYIATRAAAPNDPNFGSQWYLGKIQAPSAWDISTGSSGVVIAMVDSGVDPTHPDLASKLVPGWNFLTGTSNTADVNGHGTQTAGVAAAATNNFGGIAGVAWSNPIMPLVVLDANGNAYYSDMANAITYAADHGARIISVSLIGVSPSSVLQNAVNYAWGKGAVIFAGAGNFGDTYPNYPAACDNVLGISATDSNDSRAYFSSYGSYIDLAAPGTSILTTMAGGGYGYMDGTSFATPIAAAVGALALSVNPSMSNSALVSLLEQNADDLGTAGYDQQLGWGRVNAYRTLAGAGSVINPPADTTAPVASIGSPGAGATVAGSIQVSGNATDNVAVTRVDFLVDGQQVSSTTVSPFAFPLNTAAYANGSHTLSVKAYDAAGNAGTAAVGVNINNVAPVLDTTPPVVSITSPANGSRVSGGVTISAAATDNVHVTQVAIYIDGVQRYSGAAAPYTYYWNTKKVSSGTHVIKATAWDAAGNVGYAASISVTK